MAIDLDDIDNYVKTRVSSDPTRTITMHKDRAELLHERGRILPGYWPNDEAEAEEAPADEVSDGSVSLSDLDKQGLIDLANERGIDSSGNKPELLARLTEALV